MLSGWKGVFAVEKEENAFKSLKHNLLSPEKPISFAWPDWLPKRALNIRTLLKKHGAKLSALKGTVDMIVGGPPCQGFSTAGRRNPNDPRNRLVREYLELVALLSPSIVLIENVCGITADFIEPSGTTINYSKWIQTELAKAYTVFTNIVDTSAFGVPQRRKRFFVVALRKDLGEFCPFSAIEESRLSFLKTKGLLALPVSAKDAISDLALSRNGSIECTESKGFLQLKYLGPISSYQKVMHTGMERTQIADTRLARHRPHIKERFQKIIVQCKSDGRLNTSLSAETRAAMGLRKCAIRVIDPDLPAPTITSLPDDLLHYSEPRTLTVRENARLQSFPDWFEFQGKYTTGGNRRRKEVPRFTQVANAVPPLVAEAVGTALLRKIRSSTLWQAPLPVLQTAHGAPTGSGAVRAFSPA
jgi:DNA (cytosine-5)-methyltransferase 1